MIRRIFVLFIALVLMSSAVGAPLDEGQPAPGDYQINVHQRNCSTRPASDMEKAYKGSLFVSAWVSPDFPSFSYSFDGTATVLHWYGGSVAVGDMADACAWLNVPPTEQYIPRLTFTTPPLSEAAGAGLSYWAKHVAGDNYSLVLGNFAEGGGPMTISDIQIGIADSTLRLSVLVADSLSLYIEHWASDSSNIHLQLGDSVVIGPFELLGRSSLVFDAHVYYDSGPTCTTGYTCAFTPAKPPVPSLTQWGLISLLALILVSGVIVAFRKRAAVA